MKRKGLRITLVVLLVGVGLGILGFNFRDYFSPESRAIRLLESFDPSDIEEGFLWALDVPDEQLPESIQSRAIAVFDHPDSYTRKRAIEFMFVHAYHGHMTDDDVGRLIAEIAARIDDPSGEVRSAIYSALICMGPRAESAMDDLRHQFDTTDDPRRRWVSAITMDMISPGSMQQEVVAALRDPETCQYPAGSLALYTREDIDVDHITPIAHAALDALVMIETEEAYAGYHDRENLRFGLVMILKDHPELIDLYETYQGKGVDRQLTEIIEDAKPCGKCASCLAKESETQ
jgi:hypothetical protein